MLKNISQLECTVDGKVGRFLLDCDTPLHLVKEMLFQFQAYVAKVEEAVKEQQKVAEPVVAPVPDICEVKVEDPKIEEFKTE